MAGIAWSVSIPLCFSCDTGEAIAGETSTATLHTFSHSRGAGYSFLPVVGSGKDCGLCGQWQEYYHEIQDGWYGSTGGNFKFGLQGSFWMKSTGIGSKGGKVFGQNFSDNPTLPYYADFSVMKKW